MFEANLNEMARMIMKERLARAERARLARSVRWHRGTRKARRADARRAACRRSEQAAY